MKNCKQTLYIPDTRLEDTPGGKTFFIHQQRVPCKRFVRQDEDYCWQHRRAAPAAEPPGAVPVCEDCGMRHDPDDKASCIEGHGEP